MHSGAGRIVNLRMNTMSLYESGDSNGSISLSELVKGNFNEIMIEEPSLEKIAYLIVHGG